MIRVKLAALIWWAIGFRVDAMIAAEKDATIKDIKACWDGGRLALQAAHDGDDRLLAKIGEVERRILRLEVAAALVVKDEHKPDTQAAVDAVARAA